MRQMTTFIISHHRLSWADASNAGQCLFSAASNVSTRGGKKRRKEEKKKKKKKTADQTFKNLRSQKLGFDLSVSYKFMTFEGKQKNGGQFDIATDGDYQTFLPELHDFESYMFSRAFKHCSGNLLGFFEIYTNGRCLRLGYLTDIYIYI